MKEVIQIPGFYDYLNLKKIDISLLSSRQLDQLRNEYNKYRNTLYKKRSRQKHTVCEIKLDYQQLQFFKQKAAEHKLYLSEFIKLSAINYCQQRFLVPNRAEFQQILHSFSRIEEAIKRIEAQKLGKLMFADKKYETLFSILSDLKEKTIQSITKPTNISLWIENELKTPEFKKYIISKLLNQSDY